MIKEGANLRVPSIDLALLFCKANKKIKDNKYFLLIEDNGIGMNKEVLDKMKNPFFTTKKRGSGLGVSLIYEIIEAHNGKIEYLSEYGKGTKVTLYFPIV